MCNSVPRYFQDEMGQQTQICIIDTDLAESRPIGYHKNQTVLPMKFRNETVLNACRVHQAHQINCGLWSAKRSELSYEQIPFAEKFVFRSSRGYLWYHLKKLK